MKWEGIFAVKHERCLGIDVFLKHGSHLEIDLFVKRETNGM